MEVAVGAVMLCPSVGRSPGRHVAGWRELEGRGQSGLDRAYVRPGSGRRRGPGRGPLDPIGWT